MTDHSHVVPAARISYETLLHEGPRIVRPVVTFLCVTALFFGGLAVWSAMAPLASGAVTQGMVRVDTNKKTIQHLEGGIIREILVRDGDRVRAGQTLVRLDPMAVQADQAVLQNQSWAAQLEEARLLAERAGQDDFNIPAALKPVASRRDLAALISVQRNIIRSQRSAMQGDIDVQGKKIAQQQAQIESLNTQIVSTQEQIRLFKEELATAQDLLARGYERKPRVLGLQRSIAQAEGDLSSLNGRLETAGQTIAEVRAQIEAIRRQRDKIISDDLEKARSKKEEAEQQLRKGADKLRRIDVVAPQDGYVLGLKFFTAGAVVGAGAPILDIVPDNETLVLFAKVNPLDIDVVHEGLPAQVRLIAYKQRIVPTLPGLVTQVSADAVTDDNSKGQFYTARIEVKPEELSRIPGVKLYPGMPIEAVILTGERTLLDYLLRPLLDSFSHSFREQ
ncbi:HlyD family type I secretion periplasmic adaptor subunit [Bradyrhizobium xenonodulans]|uniref:Membrane fusion protein (MFP) family protein n=1 Tax=Bradyrhizobium xenonodulans TaxID=2736875 RepID=A0ABY7MAR4_9BRAD|nr:HlyD family type I secretion periplasmic adaptor subunit [Bradyrhizobium xenonodulans]WBL75263.1 HlyD family type I secretion periplasmic adaptor subunit [Bradyrhizobium xenonodulans]